MKEERRVTEQRETELHNRLLASDPTASAEIAELLLDYIVKVLRRDFPGQRDETVYDEAASQAIIEYLKNPASFDRTQARLSTHLINNAKADLRTLISRRSRIDRKEISLGPVEEGDTDENKMIEMADPKAGEALMIHDIDILFAAGLISEQITDPVDLQLIALMRQGVRDTERYAAVLNIQHLSTSDKRRIVKQNKDRLDKIIERIGENLRDQKKQ